ncbi:hypothetical protein F5148DRAFT_1219285 [Russula earlei]|uniref:Uncharacterized protein n=1 Tax=Russula earlei TaxID=71964 RepID=A0ACC0U2Z7_9AGAM|nr:hypothetical protein F5148DRAFT_1219285 [Russula earlei]
MTAIRVRGSMYEDAMSVPVVSLMGAGREKPCHTDIFLQALSEHRSERLDVRRGRHLDVEGRGRQANAEHRDGVACAVGGTMEATWGVAMTTGTMRARDCFRNIFSKTSSSKISRKAHSQTLFYLELHLLTSRHKISIPLELAQLAMTAGPPNPDAPSDYTCLLRGPLEDFLLYSGQEQSQWLIDIAHDICDPSQKRGTLQVLDAARQAWIDVNPRDPLTASKYRYHVQAVISLSKISHRAGRSITSQRDGKCWVTEFEDPLTNSHMCPKRMGDHFLRIIYRDFVSTIPPPAPPLTIYDDICVITLIPTLDRWFDKYELGLRLVGPGLYECHSFLPQGWPQGLQRTIVGSSRTPSNALIHGYRIRPPQPRHPRNPSPGLIRWHYLQGLQNIYFYERPMRMEGDSDDEGTDSDFEWPSANLDRGRAMQGARSVAEWIIAAK